MRLQAKPVWLLIGVHTLCLVIGFWFLSQLVISSTEHQISEAAWADLTSHSGELASLAATLGADDFKTDSSTPARLKSVSTGLGSERAGVVVVNWGWNVMLAASDQASLDWKSGDHIDWQPEPVSGNTGPQRGHLVSPEGRRAAIRYPVADASAYLVVYEPHVLTPWWHAALTSSLALSSAIAFVWTWVLSSVATYLLSARLNSEESDRKAQSEHDALRSAQDLLRTRDAVIFGLAKLAESRDPETGHHLERISLYSTRLANALRMLPKYHRIVTPGFIRLLGISSVLHDIGKVGLEDTVLLKPGRLNEEERKKMQEHTLVAGECLKEIEQRLGASNFLQTAREIAMHHHERWDGNGYPAGLAGEAIPLAARIVTVADVYDALSSKRVYKEAFPHEECVRLIREGAGSQFDPELVGVFLSIQSDFNAIRQRFVAQSDSYGHQQEGRMTAAQETVLLEVVSSPKTSTEANAGRSSSVA